MAAEKKETADDVSKDTEKNEEKGNLIKDKDSGIIIEEFQENVLLIHGILSIDEQMEILQEMLKEEKIVQDRLKKYRGDNYKVPIKDGLVSMYTKQKMGGDLMEEYGDSIYYKLISKATKLIHKNYKLYDKIDLSKSKLGHIQAAKYKSNEGKLKNHIDGIFHGDNAVFLFSIGCIANFYVKGPKMENGKLFKFKSGDMLFFDATNKANILHGIESIDDGSTTPKELKEKFEMSNEYRIGLQMRQYYQK